MRPIRCILILLFAGTGFLAEAQKRYLPAVYIEAGTGTNLAFFDVGGSSPGFTVQGGVMYDLAPNWRLGADLGIHRVNGSDEGTQLASRGYAFRSNLTQISAKGIYVVKFNPRPVKKWKMKLEPRVFANLGLLQFNTRPNMQLATLDNGDYLTVSPFAAVGAGVSYLVSRDLYLLLEAAANIAGSDYLEGFADPENSQVPDVFCTMLIKFVYKVPTQWK